MAKKQVLLRARQLFSDRVDWLKFFREVLGVNGAARQVFREQAEYLAFEQTDEYAEIERMMFRLKSERCNPRPKAEPERMLTIRVPESIHEAIRAEASDHQTTINKLCIAKLLQALNQDAVPPIPPSRLARMQNSRSSKLDSLMESSSLPQSEPQVSLTRQPRPDSLDGPEME